MTWYRGSVGSCGSGLVAGLCVLAPWTDGRGDSVIMKNGMVYRSQGTPDKDNTLVYIWDGLKRVVVRDSKIEKIEADNAFRTGERFQLVQPIVVHGGLMPKEVISVEAGPWNDRGRRSFRYLGSKLNKPISDGAGDHRDRAAHRQAIAAIDGFWVGVVGDQPGPAPGRDGLLGRVEQKNVRASASAWSGS